MFSYICIVIQYVSCGAAGKCAGAVTTVRATDASYVAPCIFSRDLVPALWRRRSVGLAGGGEGMEGWTAGFVCLHAC